MSNFRILSVARADVARISLRGGFRQVVTQRDRPASAYGSRDVFRHGREEGSLVLSRNASTRTSHFQLSLLRPSARAERCVINMSGAHSEWVDVPMDAGIAALFEGDANHDGRRDFLVLLSNGAAVLLERDARPRVCGVFGPPSGDLD